MLAPLLSLGVVPSTGSLAAWALANLVKASAPLVESFVQDPSGSISRLGDLLFWQGASGQQVIGCLEGLSDSQKRIEQVVGRIETAQIGIAGSLGSLTSLSMATLGVTSLAAVFMVSRLNALDARLLAMGDQLSDIQAHVKAPNGAHLDSSLTFLGRFEKTQADKELHTALTEATFATGVFRRLVHGEAEGRRRLVSLNESGRYYLLALTAQARCQILANQLKQAEQELAAEKPTLSALAQATFAEAMGKSPEVYLDPNLQGDHVTLDLVTEVYQQAHRLGAVTGAESKDAGQMFEHFRSKIYGAGGWFRPSGRAKEKLLTKLRYLMACLEDIARIESLRLRIAAAIEGKLSFQELERAVATVGVPAGSPGERVEAPIVAFAFA